MSARGPALAGGGVQERFRTRSRGRGERVGGGPSWAPRGRRAPRSSTPPLRNGGLPAFFISKSDERTFFPGAAPGMAAAGSGPAVPADGGCAAQAGGAGGAGGASFF